MDTVMATPQVYISVVGMKRHTAIVGYVSFPPCVQHEHCHINSTSFYILSALAACRGAAQRHRRVRFLPAREHVHRRTGTALSPAQHRIENIYLCRPVISLGPVNMPGGDSGRPRATPPRGQVHG
eukprot:scpid6051/ scgid31953/ 